MPCPAICYRIPGPLRAVQEPITVRAFPYCGSLYWLDPKERIVYNEEDLPVAQLKNGIMKWFSECEQLDLDDQYPYLVPDLTQIEVEVGSSTSAIGLTDKTPCPVVTMSSTSSNNSTAKLKFSGPKIKVATPLLRSTASPAISINSMKSISSAGKRIKVI